MTKTMTESLQDLENLGGFTDISEGFNLLVKGQRIMQRTVEDLPEDNLIRNRILPDVMSIEESVMDLGRTLAGLLMVAETLKDGEVSE